ncbi:MAG TPA: DUF4010 domain-containing protein, partial [Burkholderiales bacterium]|nr:DUF4010 domain-containing protein [Burkholderiales bacterium]
KIDELLLRFGASLASGLLIGLERERNPAAKAGVRTFALVALLGTLAASAGDPTWTVPVGLAAVAAMLIVAHSREPAEDPGTTTVVAALVCYLLGVLAGVGEPALAGALAIGVTALLYFKPEIEGVSTALKRHEQVSILQFLVVTFIVLPILPDRGYGPYAALNPRNIWLMVVLVSGIGLASYVALRAAGSRHGVLMTGILSGLLSSTAATVLYARRSRESPAMERLAFAVVPLANLVPLARIAVLAALVAPALLAGLAPLLGAALAAGLGVAAFFLRGVERGDAPVPESTNPAEMGTALRFGVVYAIVLLAAAWLADVAGHRGLYAAALATGTVDIDPIVLSTLNLFNSADLPARAAAATIALAYLANVAFKLGILVWFNRRLAWRALWPLAATVGAGGAAFALG